MLDLAMLFQSVIEGNGDIAKTLVAAALKDGIPPAEILDKGLIEAMGQVGRLYRDGEFFVPEMLMAARAMKAGLQVLRPQLVTTGVKPRGTIVLGTAEGDLHDIGKNLVGTMLEGAGLEVIDLGVDISSQAFVEAVMRHRPQLVGISALMTTTMASMKPTVAALEEAGLRDSIKIMVGGAPVTQAFADEIGADGYGPDAASAADLARRLVEGRGNETIRRLAK